ncbi:MAG: cold shock domain-containing protein [Anaerolineae bacterium]|jgi:CspA family cold shock protein
MSERTRGHIKRFNHHRRSGFIRPDGGSADIRVFLSDFRDAGDASALAQGAAVEFDVEHAPEGPRAVDVVVLEPENEATAGRVRGRIKWFSHQKRYGFIRRGDGLPDVFVHMNEFRSRADAYWVKDGDVVEFDVEQTPKGPSAVDVVVLEASAR